MQTPRIFWDDKDKILDHFKQNFQEHYRLIKDQSQYTLECLERIDIKNVLPEEVDLFVVKVAERYSVRFDAAYFNVGVNYYHRCLSIFVYQLKSKEDNKPMVSIPNYLAKYFIEPPIETLKRQAESLHLFLDVLKELGQDGSEIRANNNTAVLLQANFASHPKIHRGYYDAKRNGILYVQDYKTQENIRKDASVLLSSGQFTTREFVVQDLSAYMVDKIASVLKGEITHIPYLENRHFYEATTASYIPFDKDIFKWVISTRRAIQPFPELYQMWSIAQGLALVPENVDQIAEPAVWRDLVLYLKVNYLASQAVKGNKVLKMVFMSADESKRRYIEVPKDSPFYAGWLLDDPDGGAGMIRANLARLSPKPSVSINATVGVIWNISLGLGQNQARLPVDTGTFPFDFRMTVSAQALCRSNQRTANNEGQLLSHTTRVNDVKISYLALPHEKIQFDAWDKEFQEEKKAWKERNLVLDKNTPMPVKASSKEPIYLGMELEVVMKGLQRSGDGQKAFIRDIAQSTFGDHCISKSDGSIGDYGVEVVTVPATLAYHKKVFEETFFALPNAFHKRFMATDRCGIHVHVSKNSITAFKLGQLMAFINSSKNASFINDIAGRGPNHYCARQTNPGLNAHGVDISAKVGIKACEMHQVTEKGVQRMAAKGLAFRRLEHLSHYDSVNVQNAHTFEIRIFKSSSDKNRIFRILEFCESLTKFVRNHAPAQMTVYDYVEFILDKATKKDYPNVVRWLASKNYIGHLRKKGKDPKTGLVVNKLLHVYSENKVPFPDSIFHKTKTNYPSYYAKETKQAKKEAV